MSTKPHRLQRSQTTSPLNPWEALFSSVTRPRAIIAEDDTAAPAAATNAAAAAAGGGGYTILIQHSMTPSSLRQWATVSSTMICGDKKKLANKSSFARAETGVKAAHWIDSMSGPMVVQQAFEELCHRCNGAVVFVSLLGTTKPIHSTDLEEVDQTIGGVGTDYHSDDDICQSANNIQLSSDSERNRKRKELLRKFRTNGAWVDLSSNPFGWDEDATSSCNNLFVHESTIQKLQPIVETIRKAAASIEQRRRHHHRDQNTTTTLLHQQRPPIPIVFDTLTPLLQLHGVEKIIVMLKCLRRAVPFEGRSISIPTTTTTPSPPPPPTTATPILSPIVVPILYESLRPLEHRSLEDVADAMIHLKVTDISEYHASTTTRPLTDQHNTTTVIPGVIDLVRRGGGGGGGGGRGSGGKLIRHSIPIRIMRSSSLDLTNIIHQMKEDWHWEILNDDESYGTDTTTDAKEETWQTKPSFIADQPNELSTNVGSTTSLSHPRIYLQDDDPDNAFYDEEADYDYG